MDTGATNDFSAPKRIKKEKLNEDIKEFAETTMNELLGWYGYGGSRDEAKRLYQSHLGGNSSGSDSPKSAESCGWCGKQVEENVGLSSGPSSFCSELCFAQSRRANFKKNKTCDWCRHVRHTVSYVDFQDGASQLQFCSDKCLNQYKMHLFCRETEAHLELHPHMHRETNSTAGLITPELWLKNCKSPGSQTPSPRCSPKLVENDPPQTSPLPLITVAHPSKLLAVTPENKRHRKMQKKTRKRMSPVSFSSFRPIVDLDAPQDLRVRQSPIDLPRVINQEVTEESPPTSSSSNERLNERLQNAPFTPRLTQQQNGNAYAVKKPIFGVPPVTVLVPYPVILPLPLPIPIPIPLANFLFKQGKQSVNEGGANQESRSSPAGDERQSEGKTEEKIVDLEDLPQDERCISSKSLRKRKRAMETKSKIVMKKKPLPV